MFSLMNLFTPSFFIYLGCILLVAACIVLYFEHRIREQDHKIASMLSVVSTLEQIQHHRAHAPPPNIAPNIEPNIENDKSHELFMLANPHSSTEFIQHPFDLIEVSDEEEESESESEDDETDDSDSSSDIENDESDTESEEEEESDTESEEDIPIKIIKLDLEPEPLPVQVVHESLPVEEMVPVEEMIPAIEEQVHVPVVEEEMVPMPAPEHRNDSLNELSFSLEGENSTQPKKISIHLGEEPEEQGHADIDYKKIQLQKLRSIAIEKGLVSPADANKLKKPELLKLLE